MSVMSNDGKFKLYTVPNGLLSPGFDLNAWYNIIKTDSKYLQIASVGI
jgi:hypothetical protein